MENSLLIIEDCIEREAQRSIDQNKITAYFHGEESIGYADSYHRMEPIGVHLDRLHELEHGVRSPN